jgi:hypothetical protein
MSTIKIKFDGTASFSGTREVEIYEGEGEDSEEEQLLQIAEDIRDEINGAVSGLDGIETVDVDLDHEVKD